MNDSGACKETAGFLFPHRCKRAADRRCARCTKRLCAEHSRPAPDGTMACITCLKNWASGPLAIPPAPVQSPAADPSAGPIPVSRAGQPPPAAPAEPLRSGWASRGRSDPYFYGDTYYPGYGYGTGYAIGSTAGALHRSDPDDFTEADGASLTREGDEGFERDLGAS